MNDLESRLQADAHHLDEQTRPITLAEIENRRVAPLELARPRRVPVKTLAAVTAAAVFVSVIAFWVAARPGEKRGTPQVQVEGGTVPADPTASVHPEPLRRAPLYLEPSSVPAGLTLVGAQGGNQTGFVASGGGSNETTRFQQWIRFDATHTTAAANIVIQWGPGATAGPHLAQKIDDPLAGYREGSTPITVRDRAGLYSPRLSSVAWIEPAGQMVGISCTSCPRSQLVRIANSLRTRSAGGFDWPAPNDDFVLVNEAPGMQSSGANLRELTYTDGRGGGVQIGIVDDTQQPPLSQLTFPHSRLVDVRGTRGVIGTQMNTPLVERQDTVFMSNPPLMLQWLEYPNVAVTVAGKHASEAELLAVANSLRPVDAARWAELGGTPDTGTNPTTTTSTPPG